MDARVDARRPVRLHLLRRQVLAVRRAVFIFRWQCNPELKAADAVAVCGATGMPDATPGVHPLDTPSGQGARHARGVLIVHPARKDHGQGGDARMGVQAKKRPVGRHQIEIVKKDKRFDQFANIRRADEACHRTLAPAQRATKDLARGVLCLVSRGNGIGKNFMHIQSPEPGKY